MSHQERGDDILQGALAFAQHEVAAHNRITGQQLNDLTKAISPLVTALSQALVRGHYITAMGLLAPLQTEVQRVQAMAHELLSGK